MNSYAGSRLMASPQARVAFVISVLYVVSTTILRPTLFQVVAGVTKMLSIVYTVGCMVSGGCGLLGWANVAGLAMFWLVDMLTLVVGDGTGRWRIPRYDWGPDGAPIIRDEIRASVSAPP